MLLLKNISKDYLIAKKPFRALNDISVSFPVSQFVTILGPSGCGKTTLLNIIGGLDQYTEGDLVIQGKATKDFKMQDWDAYRNHHVGFVFQNYNLISHLTILENVEISLRLTGVDAKERKERATNALREMGIESELNKKPNQLSGGQLQRVAIARALVNDPSVILADEPTGALDSKTSDQVISILKEVSKTRLVIMVTHNEEIAMRFSDRVIKMRDGAIISDSGAPKNEKAEETAEYTIKRTSMSLPTALKSSYKNLLTKKGRTILTAIAGSLGIIGVGLVAAISNGFQGYVDRVERDTMANYPIAVFAQSIDYSTAFTPPKTNYTPYPEGEELIVYDRTENDSQAITINNNLITGEFLTLVDDLKDEGLVASSMINYPSDIHVVVKPPAPEVSPRFLYSPSYNNFTPLPSGLFTQLPGNEEYMLEFYDLLGKNSHFPTNKNEIMLVVDKYGRLSIQDLVNVGIANNIAEATTLKTIPFDDLLGKEYKMFTRDDYYYKVADNADDIEKVDVFGQTRVIERFRPRSATSIYNDETIGETLTISGILRAKPNVQVELVTIGLVYTQELNEHMFNINQGNNVAKAQVNNVVFNQIPNETNLNEAISFYSATKYNDPDPRILAAEYLTMLKKLGAEHTDVSFDDPAYKAFLDTLLAETYSPVESIALFAKDSASKQVIKERIKTYNEGKDEKFHIKPFDAVELITDSLGTLINVITIVLVVFTSISLVVSGLLIGIITYISVIERTKEIGIMRAIGARKKDISRLFNAETLMIGLLAGTIGVLATYLLSIPINLIINHILPEQNIGNIAFLAPWTGLFLLVFNILLTIVSGLIPSRVAANKKPVEALRTE